MSTPFFKANLPTQLSEEDVTKLDNICLEVTKQFFEEKYAHLIIDQLKYCRTFQKGYYKTTPDFRHFSGIYHMIKKHSSYDDYVVFRKYLQTLSAVYRWHFAKYDNVTAYNYLHERVKIETHCEHCGSLSKALIDRLIKENLWAVWQLPNRPLGQVNRSILPHNMFIGTTPHAPPLFHRQCQT